MKNTHLAKTLTGSLPGKPRDIFAFLCDPHHLSLWHPAFCRSIRHENGSFIVESPRGSVPVRFVRDDHSLVLDLYIQVQDGVELIHAIRLLSNGEGSEIVWTLVKPEGLSDQVFHEQLRWAGSALHGLRKGTAQNRILSPEPSAPDAVAAGGEPLQAPSLAEVSSMPLSGKKLFIGNLSYDWTDDQLRAHFSELGTVVTAEVARFRGRGGRSRGFGFVEMSTEPEAQGAIEKLHNGTAGGRVIIVRLAKSQESRPAKEIASPAPSAEKPTEPVEPGNERFPRTPSSRSRNERPRRGGPARTSERTAPPRRMPGGRPPRPATAGRPYQEQDISNKNGYEIFPRRAPGSPEPTRSSAPDSTPSRPSGEASPYMDDTGDIENHGHRPPRHRRRS